MKPRFPLWMLAVVLIAFLAHKGYAILVSAIAMPFTPIDLALHGFSFYIYLNLLLGKMWAWSVVVALNVLSLTVALVVFGVRREWGVWWVVFENIAMLLLLYVYRRHYLNQLIAASEAEERAGNQHMKQRLDFRPGHAGYSNGRPREEEVSV